MQNIERAVAVLDRALNRVEGDVVRYEKVKPLGRGYTRRCLQLRPRAREQDVAHAHGSSCSRSRVVDCRYVRLVRRGDRDHIFERPLLAVFRTLLHHLGFRADGMDAEQQQPHPPGVDRERDAHFLIRVDTALDRHRKNSEPPPPNLQETVIHAQAPTPDAGVGAPASAPAGEAKSDTLPRPLGIGSAATPQFFGAGGPMCVALFLIQIASDLSVPGPTRMRRFDESTLQSRKASRPSSPPPAIVGIGNKGT